MEAVGAALARGDAAEAAAAARAWAERGRGLPRGLWVRLGSAVEKAGGGPAAAAGVHALAVEQHPGDALGWASFLRSLRALRDSGGGSGDVDSELPGLDEAQEAAARAAGRDASVAGATLWREILEDWRIRGSADQGAVREARAWHLRRLTVPGQGLESDLEEYVHWEEGRGEPDAAERVAAVREMCKAATESFAEVKHLEENVAKAAGSLGSGASDAPGDQCPEAEEALLRAYRLYSGVHQRAGDLAGARAVWERSVAEVAARPALWREYARFLESSADAGQGIRAGILGDVFQIWIRATEHCWDSGSVLAAALRAGERFIHCDPALAWERGAEIDVAGLLQRLEDETELRALGLEGAVEVLLASLDPIRRALSEALAGTTEEEEGTAAVPFEDSLSPIGAMEIADLLRKAFETAVERLMRAFPESHQSGPSLAMHTYWACCEARLLGDPIAGREVWARVLGPVAGARPSGAAVTGAARFERKWGDVPEARLLFKRFFQQPLAKGQNGPSGSSSSGLDEEGLVLREWLEMEREHGSAEDYAAAAALVEPRLDALEALRRKHDAGVGSRGGGGGAEALLRGRKRPRSEAEAVPSATLAASRHPVFDDRLTVFVKNVPFAYDQAGFRAIFCEVEGVVEARLVLDRNSGRSRGFGYVTFASRAGLDAAVALNGTKVGGKELYVAASKPPTGPRSSGAARGGRGRGGSRGGNGGSRGKGGRGRGGGGGGAGASFRGPEARPGQG